MIILSQSFSVDYYSCNKNRAQIDSRDIQYSFDSDRGQKMMFRILLDLFFFSSLTATRWENQLYFAPFTCLSQLNDNPGKRSVFHI